jgi:signal transduction histidine kinase
LQAALDALPAHAALLDRAGRVVFLNRSWRDKGRGIRFIGGTVGVGDDYVEACRTARDADPAATRRLARGIAAVLAGRRRRFEIEPAGAPATRPRRFRSLVAPLGAGALVLHLPLARAGAPPDGTTRAVAHDLVNLLLGMAGLLDAALAGLAPESALAPRLGAVREGVEHAGALARRLLAARGESKTPAHADLAGAASRALDLLAARLPPNVVLERDLAPVAGARIDPVEVERILLNLGANAADALGAAGGRIRVALARVPARSVPAGLARRPHARLLVADDGAGIPPEVLDRIFEPFFTTKPAGRGTGLGLATVAGIVARRGGRIEVRSAPGEGTALTIWLPLAPLLNRTRSGPR